MRYGQPRSRKDYKAVAVIFEGLGDFAEQYFEFANELDAQGIKPLIIDFPGQGGSDRYLPHTPMKRHSTGFDSLLQQLHNVMEDVALSAAVDQNDNHKRLPLALIGHSMGGHIALRYLAEYNTSSRGVPIFSCAVLTAPMIGMKAVNNVPFPFRQAILFGLSLFPTAYVPRGCDWYEGYRERWGFKGIFTSDPDRYALQGAYYTHPEHRYLATGSPTNQWLLDAVKSCKILNMPDYLRKIDVPVLIAEAGSDQLVDNQDISRAARHIPHAEILSIDGAQHEIIMESDRFRKVFLERFFTFLEENVLNRPDKGKTYIQ